jgi:dTDP-glucose pyrophosphorylase
VSYRVIIPTAGIGSRLGNLTKYINKSLVGIANRPTISHIIEQFPEDCEYVIALGHKGKLVRDFLELAYPDKVFYFVYVDPFEGEGSGLGRTLIACKNYLQQPFVFISCDTLVEGKIKKPNHNWMGFTTIDDVSQYRTLTIEKDKISKICEKGVLSTNNHAYIGLAGIFDFEIFWEKMLDNSNNAIVQGESYGMKSLINASNVVPYEFRWFDTGNPEELANTRRVFEDIDAPNILEKENEAIWFVGETVIKFSDDETFISNRVKRLEELKGFVPEIFSYRSNMYCYKKIQGKVLSDIVNIPIFNNLMEYTKKFWIEYDLDYNQEVSFINNCEKFYKNKTFKRIELFYKNFKKCDNNTLINGEEVPTLGQLLNSIDWGWLNKGMAGRFHGDFHFENILWSEEERKFTFLDWRQDFGGDLKVGDIYYDLAKLMHGIIINHGIIASNKYSASWEDGEINYKFQRKKNLVQCELKFSEYINIMGYDLKKIRILTALIYLNIAALHHYPYSILLYGLGKKMLKNEMDGDA